MTNSMISKVLFASFLMAACGGADQHEGKSTSGKSVKGAAAAVAQQASGSASASTSTADLEKSQNGAGGKTYPNQQAVAPKPAKPCTPDFQEGKIAAPQGVPAFPDFAVGEPATPEFVQGKIAAPKPEPKDFVNGKIAAPKPTNPCEEATIQPVLDECGNIIVGEVDEVAVGRPVLLTSEAVRAKDFAVGKIAAPSKPDCKKEVKIQPVE